MPDHYHDDIDMMGAEIMEFDLDVDPDLIPDDPEDDIQETVRKLIEEARRHYEDEIEPDQVKATDYYHARPFGDEEAGRSKVVDTTTRDAVRAMLPSLLRIFTGSERVVEFTPTGEEDVPRAQQKTDYVNYVFMEDNPGFLTLLSWFKDALIRRQGWVKWYHQEYEEVVGSHHSGLTYEQLVVLASDPGVEVDEESLHSYEIQTEEGPVTVYEVRIQRLVPQGRIRVEAVPPEEICYTPDPRNLEEATIVHLREVPADQLIAMGVDPEIVEEVQAAEERRRTSDSLAGARHHGRISWEDRKEQLEHRSRRPVLFAEAYVRIDTDGDDISELRLFQCVGKEFKIINGDGRGELVDEVPLAFLTMDPEPHTITGLSAWDYTKDLQRINSQIWRATLDSLGEAVDPRTEVVATDVNLGDLMNPERSKFIRVRRPGMMREVKHEFVGPYTLPVLEALKDLKEDRLGISRAAEGLDADSLQSSTKAAVAATLSKGQQQIEMVARIFAETGVKRMFQGIARLVTKHQDQPRMVRLRNQFVEVDPRQWNTNMDITVNVGLGAGTTEEKLTTLLAIAEKQEALMAQGDPLVTRVEYRNTLGKAIEMLGYKNSNEFFRPWGPEEEQQFQEKMAQQEPPPDPALMLVQIEQMRAQMEAQQAEAKVSLEQMKLMLEEQKLRLEDDHRRDKLAREYVLKAVELEEKADQADMKAAIEIDRMAQDRDKGGQP